MAIPTCICKILARAAEELVEVKDALGNLAGSAGEDGAAWLEVGRTAFVAILAS